MFDYRLTNPSLSHSFMLGGRSSTLASNLSGAMKSIASCCVLIRCLISSALSCPMYTPLLRMLATPTRMLNCKSLMGSLRTCSANIGPTLQVEVMDGHDVFLFVSDKVSIG